MNILDSRSCCGVYCIHYYTLSINMQRTQIYIPGQLKTAVKEAARASGESFSDFVREAIAAQLRWRQLRRKNGTAMFLDILERADKERTRMPKDSAVNHDRYLYGAK